MPLTIHPGPWELGQIAGNTAARSFWRQVVRPDRSIDWARKGIALQAPSSNVRKRL
ncbi:MAG: hypothetical protein ABI671_16465 [Burkholderiales bacterium]